MYTKLFFIEFYVSQGTHVIFSSLIKLCKTVPTFNFMQPICLRILGTGGWQESL